MLPYNMAWNTGELAATIIHEHSYYHYHHLIFIFTMCMAIVMQNVNIGYCENETLPLFNCVDMYSVCWYFTLYPVFYGTPFINIKIFVQIKYLHTDIIPVLCPTLYLKNI